MQDAHIRSHSLWCVTGLTGLILLSAWLSLHSYAQSAFLKEQIAPDRTIAQKPTMASPRASQATLTYANAAAPNTSPAKQQRRQTDPNRPVYRTVRARSRHDVLQILSNRLISVDYRDAWLEDVVRDLRERLQLNMAPMWRSLATIGVGPDTRVNLQVDKVPAAVVLDLIVESFSTAGVQNAGCDITGSVVVIKPAAQIDRRATRVYYITDVASSVGLIQRNTTQRNSR